MSDALRTRIIRLAAAHPELRRHLLPLVTAARTPSPGEELTLYHQAPPHNRGDQFRFLDSETRFTPYGPKPEGTFYKVESVATGGTITLPDWYFSPGKPPAQREPLEEAYKKVERALKQAGLLSQLRRVNSSRRMGRRLQPNYGATVSVGEITRALAPVVQFTSQTKGEVKVQTGAATYQTFDLSLTVSVPEPNWDDTPIFALELYAAV